MYLSKKIVQDIRGAEIPSENYFQLPEKVIQFGAGVLLRALPDYFIDKANKNLVFNGRIVIVKSTEASEIGFDRQDGLYTHCIRGLENGKNLEFNIINASISRVLPAKTKWAEILQCAVNPLLELVISNTTEVGIVLTRDNIRASPPESYPGKLLAFLYRRFNVFEGDPSKGLVIIPTELVPNNADLLLSILVDLAVQNRLENEFQDWLKNANYFCNSLVDRIVPGRPPEPQSSAIEKELGCQDQLMLISEPYCLWAIESKQERVREILSFSRVDTGVIIASDINIFRELKLRLLNGSHTFSCGLAVLAGIEFVRDGMEDALFGQYIKSLMLDEIVPSITSEILTEDEAEKFSQKVLDRYANPYIAHPWLAITLQYSSKMCLRNVPLIIKYLKRFKKVPRLMTLGFAAHILFMRAVETLEGSYYGEVNGKKYLINDKNAEYFAFAWRTGTPTDVTEKVLGNKDLWSVNLCDYPEFKTAVADILGRMINGNIREVIKMQFDQ